MSEVKSLVDFLNINKDFKGYALIQCTDRYTVLELSDKDIDISENKLLEIRIFNKNEERRLFRLDLQDEFCYYVTNDTDLKPEIDYFDIQQKYWKVTMSDQPEEEFILYQNRFLEVN